MELVKGKNIKNKELINLLYRKEILENTIEKTSKAIVLHNDLIKAIELKLKDKSLEPLDKCRLSVELDKEKWEIRTFVTTLKSNTREYEHYIKKRLEEIGKEELTKDDVKFIDLEKTAKEMAKIELYGSTAQLPDNIEFAEIIKSEQKYIKTLEKLLKENKKQSKTAKGYELAKLEVERLDTEIHIQTLTKRLNSRIEYYTEQFLPTYTKELAEAKEKIEVYYKRGQEIAKLGMDVQISFLLQKYEEHKADDEKLWLYYTALRNRVNAIIKEIKTNHKNDKKLMVLTRPI
jgi:hypothetical protein